MLDLVYRVKIFFWRLGHVELYRVHVVFCFDEDVAFLHVLVDVDFDFDTVAGDAADRMFLELVLLEKYVNHFFVGAVVGGSQNAVADHAFLVYTASIVSTRFTMSVTVAI